MLQCKFELMGYIDVYLGLLLIVCVCTFYLSSKKCKVATNILEDVKKQFVYTLFVKLCVQEMFFLNFNGVNALHATNQLYS